jgi:3-oxoacyl-[acyl-carrier-protein] synthase-3
MYKASLKAFARAVPDFVVTNDDMSKLVDTSDEWIYTRSGIKNRHISLEKNTSDYASEVFRGLMEKSGTDARDIELIIVATTTPDYLTPTTSCIVQHNTGAAKAFCLDVAAGCSGFVYALSVAEKYISCGTVRNAVVIGADLLSKFTDWTDRTTCVLFGDGSGGVLLERSDSGGILAERLRTDGGENIFAIRGGSVPVINPWNKAERTFEHVKMNGRAVWDFATREVPKNMQEVVEKAGLSFDDLDYIVAHQANARILEGIAKRLKVSLDKFYMNVADYGNTSAGTIGIALSEMNEAGLIKPGSGQKLLLTGYGSGLTWGSIAVQL